MFYSKMEGKMNYSIRNLERMHAQILDNIMNIEFFKYNKYIFYILIRMIILDLDILGIN